MSGRVCVYVRVHVKLYIDFGERTKYRNTYT